MTYEEAKTERDSMNNLIYGERLEILKLAKQTANHVNTLDIYTKRLDELVEIIMRYEIEQELKEKGVIE